MGTSTRFRFRPHRCAGLPFATAFYLLPREGLCLPDTAHTAECVVRATMYVVIRGHGASTGPGNRHFRAIESYYRMCACFKNPSALKVSSSILSPARSTLRADATPESLQKAQTAQACVAEAVSAVRPTLCPDPGMATSCTSSAVLGAAGTKQQQRQIRHHTRGIAREVRASMFRLLAQIVRLW